MEIRRSHIFSFKINLLR